jgi:undecaprenyl-phosphate 4-deoxy-4-formamido-L-arabinose transferase
MVLSSGTRGLRAVSFLGLAFALVGTVFAAYVIVARATGHVHATGWSSLIVITLLSSGAMLFAIGVIAEYIGVAVNAAIGKPLYLITNDLQDGPLGREPRHHR